LLEAVACLKDGSGEPVLLVYFDALLPQPYDEVADGAESCVALAVLLKPAGDGGGEFTLSLEPRSRAAKPQSATAQSLDFIRFMLSNEREQNPLVSGLSGKWQRCA